MNAITWFAKCYVLYLCIVEFLCPVTEKKWKGKDIEVTKATKKHFANTQNIDSVSSLNHEDPDVLEMNEHNSEMHLQHSTVPVQILHPATNLIWLHLCRNWRKQLDFNFHRDKEWSDESPVQRFNDTFYVSMHNILDWHAFVMLDNGLILHKGMIVSDNRNDLILIVKIEYLMKRSLRNVQNRRAISGQTDLEWWKPKVHMHFHKIRQHGNDYQLSRDTFSKRVSADSDYSVVDQSLVADQLFDDSGNSIKIDSCRQHPHVAANEEFFFTILGFDKYHHTSFEGPNDYDTHGLYWWIGNGNPQTQFSKQLTMVMGQVPECVSINTIGRICYSQWQQLMQEGFMLWNGQEMKRRYAMVSHQITDMQDRDHFMRRRGSNKYSRSDGMLWNGYGYGCSWPAGVRNLLQLGVITPGPYLLMLWKHLNKTLVSRKCWVKMPQIIGKHVTLTKDTQDIYNELPIASSLKSTIELNHTTLLGCVAQAVKTEWYAIHRPKNLDSNHTRLVMSSILLSNFHMINGCKSLLILPKTNIVVFNQMQRSWQKMLEIMLSLPSVTNWFGNISTVIALIRMTGAMCNSNCQSDLNRLQQLIRPILTQSLVVFVVTNVILKFLQWRIGKFPVTFLCNNLYLFVNLFTRKFPVIFLGNNLIDLSICSLGNFP